MKNIAVYGGAFNPPTIAHEAVAKSCLQRPDVSEVWLMPSADRYDKKFDIADVHRTKMLELVAGYLSEFGVVKVSKLELEELSPPTQTKKTFDELKRRFPNLNFRFVLGFDTYISMPEWNGGKQLQASLPILVSPRFGLEVNLGKNAIALEPIDSASDITSTEVRRRIIVGQSIESLVRPEVAEYIKANNLYHLPNVA